MPGALTWLLDNRPKLWLLSNGYLWATISKCLLYYNKSSSPSTMHRRLWELSRLTQLYAADAATGGAAAGSAVLQGLRPDEPRDWFDAGTSNATYLFYCSEEFKLRTGGEAGRLELYCSPEFWHVLLRCLLGLAQDLYNQRMILLQQQRSSNQHSRSSISSSSSSSGCHRCSGNTGSTSTSYGAGSSSVGRSSSTGSHAARSTLKILGASNLSEMLLPPDHLEVAVAGVRRAVEAEVAWLQGLRRGKGHGQSDGLFVGAHAEVVLGILQDVLELHIAAATSSSTSDCGSSKGDDATNRDIRTCISKASSSRTSNSSRSDASGSSSSRGTASSTCCSGRTSGMGSASSSSSSSNSEANSSSNGGGMISSSTSNSNVSSSSCGSTARGRMSSGTSNSKASNSSSDRGCHRASAALHSTSHVDAPVASAQLLNLLLELIALLGQASSAALAMAKAVDSLLKAATLSPVEERLAFFSARGDLLLQVLWLLAEQGSKEQQDEEASGYAVWGKVLYKLTDAAGEEANCWKLVNAQAMLWTSSS